MKILSNADLVEAGVYLSANVDKAVDHHRAGLTLYLLKTDPFQHDSL